MTEAPLPAMRPVQSSHIAAVGADTTGLYVQFKDGSVHHFAGAGGMLNGLLTAPSVGKYFSQYIRGIHKSTAVRSKRPGG